MYSGSNSIFIYRLANIVISYNFILFRDLAKKNKIKTN